MDEEMVTTKALASIRRVLAEEEGQGMAEYGLILTLVALGAIAGFSLLGGNVNTLVNGLAGQIVAP